jgi:hypothetical protein
MSAENPPTFSFNGIDFNPTYYVNESTSSGFTQEQANALYLKKTTPDTATAIETFTGGIKTNTIESVIDTDTLNIQTVSDTATNIVNIGNATTNNQTLNLNSKTINIGDTTVPSAINIISPSTFTGTATIGTIAATTINSSAVNSLLAIGSNQVNAGATLSIGNNNARTGPINIATSLTTGLNQSINIGSASITSGTQIINLGGSQIITGTGTQTINLNKPLKIGYTNIVEALSASFDKIGSYSGITSSEAVIVNNVSAATSLVNFLSVPAGIYMFQYQINYRITIASTIFTMQKFILSTTANDFQPLNIIGGEYSSLFNTIQESVVVSSPNDEYTQKFSNCGAIVLGNVSNIYLNYRIVHNVSTTVPYIIASLRLVRIG